MDPLTEQEKKKKREQDERILRIEVTLQMLNSRISRHNRSKDPIVRSTLLVDKLCTVIDIGLAYLMIDHPEIPDELKGRMKETANSITGELNFLLDWISNPQYSPDHIYGQSFIKGASKNFDASSTEK